MHRRELVRELLKAGYHSIGDTKHERFERDGHIVQIKRHGEIGEKTAERILRQARLR